MTKIYDHQNRLPLVYYTQCTKYFWLDAYQPDLASPPDATALRRMRAGQEVDKLARKQFVNGRLTPTVRTQKTWHH